MTYSSHLFLEQHQAAVQELLLVLQLVESFSRSYLPRPLEAACDAGNETHLRWWAPGQLVSRAIGSRRALRAAISLADFELLLVDQSSPRMSRIQARLPLEGQTPAAAAEWLQARLAEALPRGYSRPLRLPAGWEQTAAAVPFQTSRWTLQELARIYDQAHQLLAELAECLDLSCTPVRFAVHSGELGFGIQQRGQRIEAGFSAGGPQSAAVFFVKSPSGVVSMPLQGMSGVGEAKTLPDLQILNFLHHHLSRALAELDTRRPEDTSLSA